MNAFDATSGTIDALLALAIYAGLVFGIRAIVHRTRKTEPNPANNKWMWLSALGLAAAVFVAGGSTSGESTSSTITPINPRSDRCTQVNTAAENLSTQMPTSYATGYQDTQLKRNIMRQFSYLVVGSPDCFDPGSVASAQNFIDQTR